MYCSALQKARNYSTSNSKQKKERNNKIKGNFKKKKDVSPTPIGGKMFKCWLDLRGEKVWSFSIFALLTMPCRPKAISSMGDHFFCLLITGLGIRTLFPFFHTTGQGIFIFMLFSINSCPCPYAHMAIWAICHAIFCDLTHFCAQNNFWIPKWWLKTENQIINL